MIWSFSYPAFGLGSEIGCHDSFLDVFSPHFFWLGLEMMVRQFFEVKRILCFNWVAIHKKTLVVVLEDVDFCLADDVFMDSIPSNVSPVFTGPFGRRFCWFIFSFCIHVPVAANPSWESTHVRLTTTWVSSLKSRRIWKRRWKDFEGKMVGFGEWRRKKTQLKGECS